MSIARTPAAVASRRYARTGDERKVSGKLFGYARVLVASDSNDLETQRRVLADCAQVFEDVGSGASWNRPVQFPGSTSLNAFATLNQGEMRRWWRSSGGAGSLF